jgi:hypothetical protein
MTGAGTGSLPFGKLRVGTRQERSIHPPTTAAAILFVSIVRRTEIAVLVEIVFGVLVVLLHIDLELFPSATTLPAVITILESIASL